MRRRWEKGKEEKEERWRRRSRRRSRRSIAATSEYGAPLRIRGKN